MPKTAIVILNYNTRGYLEQFLPVVEESLIDGCEIVVVDNASTDDSVVWLAEHKPGLRTIVLSENFGYAGGYNRALKEVDSEYYLLLNTDVEVTEDWLSPLVTRLEGDSSIAAVQPKIKDYNDIKKFEYAGASGGLLDKWGYPYCRGRIFDESEIDLGQYDEAMPIFWATGAAFLVKAELFHKAGGFDERFFAHMEEIDLCWRLQHMGYEVWVEPSSEVYHVGGGTLSNGSFMKYYLNYRNNLAMLTKNLKSKNWFAVILWKMVLDGLSAINFLKSGKVQVVWAVLKAHWAYWVNLPYWIKQRKGQQRTKEDHELLSQKSIVWAYFKEGKKTFDSL